MNTKYAALSLLFATSIMAARITRDDMAKKLIAAKDLGKTFKKLEKEQDTAELSCALRDMAKKEEYMPKVARCLEMAEDPYPNEESNVGGLVLTTVDRISDATRDNTEAFAGVVASFNPSAMKPLKVIRYKIHWRDDAKGVLEQVMKKSPELITGSLPSWLAWHGFDRRSSGYKSYESSHKQIFEYLVSLATERVLSDALVIARKNKHYKAESVVYCCNSEDSPKDLIDKLETLLKLVQGRKALLEQILACWPTVLISLVKEYLVGDLPAETPSTLKNIVNSCPFM